MKKLIVLLIAIMTAGVLTGQELLRINMVDETHENYPLGTITRIKFSDFGNNRLKVDLEDGRKLFFFLDGITDLSFSGTTSIEEQEEILTKLGISLLRNYPNPFNPETTISFSIDIPGHTRVDIYNQTGQLVTTIHEGEMSRGSHILKWNAQQHNASTGVYFVRVSQSGKHLSSKMLLVK